MRIKQSEAVEEALTREDIRELIQKGDISRLQKKGTSKFASKRILEQKRKGRMRGPGKRKGKKGARKNDKTKWIEKIRPLRRLLSEMRESGQISREDYGTLYRRAKGGFFRNRNHMLYYMKENDILKKVSKKEAASRLRKGSEKKPASKLRRIVKKATQAKKAKPSTKGTGKKAEKKKK